MWLGPVAGTRSSGCNEFLRTLSRRITNAPPHLGQESLIVVGAHASALDAFSRGVGAALGIHRRRVADQRAVLGVGRGILEGALGVAVAAHPHLLET